METLQRTANRGSLSTGYDVDNSVKLERNNNTTTVEFFERNVSTSGNRTTGTISMWVKRTDLSGAIQYLFEMGNVDHTDDRRLFARFNTDGTITIATGLTSLRITNRVFRDLSSWYHIMIAIDTTQSTANDRIKLYVNGVQETSFSTTNNFSQDGNTGLAFGKQVIGYTTIDNTGGFCGYMAEVLIDDGTALSPTDVGEFNSNGIWVPKDLSNISVGTNGTYMKFENAASMGAATSGVAFTVQNINQVDQSVDTPTNNFCTLNQNWKYANVPSVLNCTDGGTIIQHNGSWSGAKATMGVQNGKWYWECKIGQRENTMWGIQTDGEDNIGSGNAQDNKSTHVLYSGFGSGGYLITTQNGTIAADTSNYSAVWSSGDIAGIALDMDNNQITYYRNGSGLGSAFTAITIHDNADKVNFPFIATYREYIKINFGGYSDWESGGNSDANGYGSFQYSVPSGYYALCTKNLAEYG